MAAEGSDHLQITVETAGDTATIRLDGELDIHTAPGVGEAVANAIDGGASTVVVDAAALRFCDSSGIQVLVQARERLLTSGGALRVEGVHGSVQKVLAVTGLLDLFSDDS
jgi:anti-sigma B factor antagonist